MAKKFDIDSPNPNQKLLVFQALADEKRLKVLDLIRDGEKNGTYLRNELDIPQSSLSYHMKLLCESGIVLARNQGKFTFYRINGEKSHNEADLLSNLLSDDENEDGEADDRHSFLFGMSHDVRTPMNAILGYTDMIRRHMDDKDVTEDCLNKIDSAGNQLMALMDEVLEIAKLASGNLIIEEMPADMRYTAREIQEQVENMAREKDVEFSIFFSNLKNQKVYCDYLHMNEVLLKILVNAIQYTEPGGEVMLTIEQVPCNLEGYGSYDFIVRDTGIGMSDEFLPHACEPFTREIVGSEGIDRGPGLGLAIAKKMLGLLGGSMEIASRKGDGTAVTVHALFRLQENEGEEQQELERDTVLVGKRVLLVEDNEMNREILKDMLEDEGIIVEEANDGDVAVAMVTDVPAGYYDGVLMDIQMPRMDGYTATRLIRHLPDAQKAAVPIIAVTANTFQKDRNKAKLAGMNELFPKPIKRKEMRETLKKYLL